MLVIPALGRQSQVDPASLVYLMSSRPVKDPVSIKQNKAKGGWHIRNDI